MKYTYDIVKKSFEDADLTLVSTEYKNTKTDLEYICNKHKHRGIQTVRYANFLKYKGEICNFCRLDAGLPVNHIPEVIYKEDAEKLGYIYKGIRYENGSAKIDFICKKHMDKGVQPANGTSIRAGKCSCKYCNGIDRTTEDFKEIMKEINDQIEILGEYTGARKRIKCRCKKHNHIWYPFVYNLLSGFGCPKCADEQVGLKKRTSAECKMNKLEAMHPDIEFLSSPILSTDYVECKCKKCKHEWSATYSNLTKPNNPTGCPKCAGSNSENKLISIIEKFGYNYERQYKYEDCRDVHKLPFDAFLTDYNILIEFDGEHHYYPIPRGDGDGVREFETTQRHDKIKTQYCIDNKIPLIRIPYWERDNMESFLFEELNKLGII